MAKTYSPNVRWLWAQMLAGIIIGGLVSRALQVGNVFIDKYLGDALYAAAIYALIALVKPNSPATQRLLLTLGITLAIEAFQLTQIPLALSQQDSGIARVLAFVLGTQFSWADIAAYWVGLGAIFGFEKSTRSA